MAESLLEELIAGGETERVEFKSRLDEDTLDPLGTIVASFLNSQGGTVVLGVDESGEVLGVPDPDTLVTEIRQKLERGISPPAPSSVNIEQVAGRPVIVIGVPRGADAPYVFRGQIAVRQGTHSVLASGGDISALIQGRQQATTRWERLPAVGVELDDLDQDEIQRTLHQARDRYGWVESKDAREFLRHLSLLENGGPCNSAVVLFGRYPARVYPQTRVRVVRFASQDAPDFVDNRVLEGHAFSLVEQITGFLRMHLPVSSRFTGHDFQRVDQPAYPWAALREGVMNALVHRDYAAFDGSAAVSIFPDRVEIWNAGRLPDDLSVEDLKRGGISRPPNPDIAHVFYLRGLIERVGIGARLIIHDCLQAGLPEPVWEVIGGGVRLTFRLGEPTKVGRVSPLNARQLAYLRESAAGETIRAVDYHRGYAADVSERHARTDLSELVDAGYLSRMGSGPATAYLRTSKPFVRSDASQTGG